MIKKILKALIPATYRKIDKSENQILAAVIEQNGLLRAEIARNVKWIYNDSFVILNPKATDKNNVRSNSVYEEYNIENIKIFRVR